MALGTPQYLFKDIFDISPDFFTSRSIRFVLCDIDNTLVTYDDAVPTASVAEWLCKMADSGIVFAFVSNNSEERVKTFCDPLKAEYIAKSGKPFTTGIRKLMKRIGASKQNTAFLGDQILTDSLAAAFSGLISVNVPPIKDRTGAFFRFKRKIEVLYMRDYWKKHPDQTELKSLWFEKTGNKINKRK